MLTRSSLGARGRRRDDSGGPAPDPRTLRAGRKPQRFWTLTWTLAVLEFRLKFFGSVLGYFWQLMRPLLMFGVLYVVFTELVRLGGGVNDYPVVLLIGIVSSRSRRGDRHRR